MEFDTIPRQQPVHRG